MWYISLFTMKLSQSLVISLTKFIWPTEVTVVHLTRGMNTSFIEQSVSAVFVKFFFSKTKKNMKNHTSICSAREGITYAFDNGQILNYQDNFKYLGDLPFTVYFDFETTTGGNSVFFYSSMYVIGYCQIYSFHPSLNLDKIVIFRSYQQIAE